MPAKAFDMNGEVVFAGCDTGCGSSFIRAGRTAQLGVPLHAFLGYGLRDFVINDVNHPTYGSSAVEQGSRAAQNLDVARSEEHTSELQSLMRISYAGFCLKKKHNTQII